jgi:zinc finger FYVE domain-containing protein 1
MKNHLKVILNHTYFNENNVLFTSNKQVSCIVGVWCAYDKKNNLLIFDKEGLLGTSNNEFRRMRLLLKILSISDVVIYRTRADRFSKDIFK